MTEETKRKKRGRPPKEKPAEPVAEVKADPFDKKLTHFTYTRDDTELDHWEFGEGYNPLEVPKDVKERYPGLRFHWVSQTTLDHRGKGYKGWQLFSDGEYPQGVKRGNDMFLAAMPEERAQAYNNWVAEQSTAAVRRLQERGLEVADRASAIDASGEVYVPEKSGMQAGVTIGSRQLSPRSRPQQRGMSREEAHEIVAKQIEDRRKGRVHFDMGKRG